MVTERKNLRLLKGEYIGTDSKLYGLKATLIVQGEPGDTSSPDKEIRAKFDDKSSGFSFGWHSDFTLDQFQVDWKSDLAVSEIS